MHALDPFRSKSLIYCSYNSPEDDDFFHSIQSDPVAFINSCPSIQRPADRRFTETIRKYLLENSLLFVVIYISGEEPGTQISKASKEGKRNHENTYVNPGPIKHEPIGTMFLKLSSPDMAHHRCSELGIDIKREYQGQGYGTEAINWALDWAFRNAGLHRVELNVLGWNSRARKLYERIGFREEGRRRECLFKDDKWWDEVHMGILRKEWEQIRQIELKLP
jgi:RimJ/RimL family protein N-acetyltransferase